LFHHSPKGSKNRCKSKRFLELEFKKKTDLKTNKAPDWSGQRRISGCLTTQSESGEGLWECNLWMERRKKILGILPRKINREREREREREETL